MPAPILVADLPWLLYRAFFALPSSITDDEGRPVNALLGTVNALLTAVQARPPRAVVACTGAENAEYRVALYPDYHAQRDPMPDALREQWERAPALLDAMGWYVPASEELEADDVMYSYALTESEAGGETLLLTGDRDLYQAVGERVRVLVLGKGSAPPSEIDVREVRRRYGVSPEMVPDFIALRGDPSDNLPGAPGIGEKTARDLLLSYGSLDGAIASGLSERPRVAAALRDNADLLRTFRRIATLVRVDVDRPPDRPTDFAGGADAAERLGMRNLAGRLRRLDGAAQAAGARRRGSTA